MDQASKTNRLITPTPKQTHIQTDKQIDQRSSTGEADLELLAEMETNSLPPTFPRFDQRFLEHLQVLYTLFMMWLQVFPNIISAPKIHICAISYYNLLQAAADRHLLEKGQIRDTLGLLRWAHFSLFNEADVTLHSLSRISVTLDFLFFFRIYQKSAPRPGGSGDEHEEKRKRARKGNK